MSGQQIASIVAYRIDQDQFDELVSVKNAIQRMSEAVVRLAPPLIFFRVTDMESGFTVEGANLNMILKNNQQIRMKLVFKNKQGGPARVQAGSVQFTATAPTGCFTVEQDASDETIVLVKGNPQAAGDENDIGTVDCSFDGDAGEGVKSRQASEAVSVVPGDAEITQLEAQGEAEDQPDDVTPTP